MDEYFVNRRVAGLEAGRRALSLEEFELEVARLGSELERVASLRPDDDRRAEAIIAYQDLAMALEWRRRREIAKRDSVQG